MQLKYMERGGNQAQAVVSVLVALAFSLATLVAAQAQDKWQGALREEVKYSAAMVEDVRYVYGDEAQVGFNVATSIARADALAAAAEGRAQPEAWPALIEAHSVRTAAERLQKAYASEDASLLEERYRDGDYFDVLARLADARQDTEHVVEADPESVATSGTRLANWALVIALVPIPFAVLYFVLWRVWRRRPPTADDDDPEDTEDTEDVALLPSLSGARGRRGVFELQLAAWLLLILIPPLQIYHSSLADEATADAARAAVQVMRDVEVGNTTARFDASVETWLIQRTGMRETRELDVKSLGREAVAGQAALIAADASAEPVYRRIADGMLRNPGSGDDLDGETRAAISAGPEEWDALVKHQRDLSFRADEAGRRSDIMTLALLLAGVATTLGALTAADRRSFSVAAMAGATVVGAAVAAALGGFI